MITIGYIITNYKSDISGKNKMTNDLAKEMIQQLNSIIEDYERSQKHEDSIGNSILAFGEVAGYLARSRSAVNRITGDKSAYSQEIDRIINGSLKDSYKVEPILGIIRALRGDIEKGYLVSVNEIIHAKLFSDYLEMAEYLLNKGHKDPAAVITGSTLEVHLKKLCIKNGIDINEMTLKGPIPKRVESMNSELAKIGAYTKTDQKNVTAWYGLRTDAAHGDYDKYDEKMVSLMISGVKDFIKRNSA